jgi:hypothetical protein
VTGVLEPLKLSSTNSADISPLPAARQPVVEKTHHSTTNGSTSPPRTTVDRRCQPDDIAVFHSAIQMLPVADIVSIHRNSDPARNTAFTEKTTVESGVLLFEIREKFLVISRVCLVAERLGPDAVSKRAEQATLDFHTHDNRLG